MDRYQILLRNRFSNKPGKTPYFNITERISALEISRRFPSQQQIDFRSVFMDLFKINYESVREEHILFSVSKSFFTRMYEITPENLYTFLLMKGFEVPYEDIEGKENHETNIGTFIFKNGKPDFKPKNPVEFKVRHERGHFE